MGGILGMAMLAGAERADTQPAHLGNLGIGDTLVVSMNFDNFPGMSYGNTTAIEVIDSIRSNGDTTTYHLSVTNIAMKWFFESGMMVPLIRNGEKTRLTILDTLPESVSNPTAALSKSKWILGGKSNLLFNRDMEHLGPFALIPVPDRAANFDSIVVRQSDTLGIRWKFLSSPSEDAYGEFIRYSGKEDRKGVLVKESRQCCLFDHSFSFKYGDATPIRLPAITTSTQLLVQKDGPTTLGAGYYRTWIAAYRPKRSVPISIRRAGNARQTNAEAAFYLVNGRLAVPEGAYFSAPSRSNPMAAIMMTPTTIFWR